MELNHKTRQWVNLESTYQPTDALNRLAVLRVNNGDVADYKIEFVNQVQPP